MLKLIAFLVIGLSSVSAFADTETVLSPLAQFDQGVPIGQIQCSNSKVLLESPHGKPACVFDKSVDRLVRIGFTVIEVVQIDVSDADAVPEEVTIVVLNASSPEEFVHDGREFQRTLQRMPSPWPMYDRFVASTTGIIPANSNGTFSLKSTPHEKYSVIPNVGFYLEDWMPSVIPTGQRLIAADTYYSSYDIGASVEKEEYIAYYTFVPTTFVFYQNATTWDLQTSQGFTMGVKRSNFAYNEVGDITEHRQDILKSQPDNYGRCISMTRDGTAVSACEGGNKWNPYSASVAFHPDEFTIVHVNSKYHTIDELIPVFNSVMR